MNKLLIKAYVESQFQAISDSIGGKLKDINLRDVGESGWSLELKVDIEGDELFMALLIASSESLEEVADMINTFVSQVNSPDLLQQAQQAMLVAAMLEQLDESFQALPLREVMAKLHDEGLSHEQVARVLYHAQTNPAIAKRLTQLLAGEKVDFNDLFTDTAQQSYKPVGRHMPHPARRHNRKTDD